MGKRRDLADRPRSWQMSPVRSGFRRNDLICFVARLANSINYSLRPQLANKAAHLRLLRPKRGSCGIYSEVPYLLDDTWNSRSRLTLAISGSVVVQSALAMTALPSRLRSMSVPRTESIY